VAGRGSRHQVADNGGVPNGRSAKSEKGDTKGGAPGLSRPGQWMGVRAEGRQAAGRDERAEQRLGLVRARRTAPVTAGLGLARAVGARDHLKRGLHAGEYRGSKGCDLG